MVTSQRHQKARGIRELGESLLGREGANARNIGEHVRVLHWIECQSRIDHEAGGAQEMLQRGNGWARDTRLDTSDHRLRRPRPLREIALRESGAQSSGLEKVGEHSLR